MTQLSAKILARRTMIVCLTILIPATGIAIETAPQAEPIRASVKAYVAPVIQHTAEMAATIHVASFLKELIHKDWKRV
jgi:hypothetical protein